MERPLRPSVLIRRALSHVDRSHQSGGANAREGRFGPRIGGQISRLARILAIALMILLAAPDMQLHAQTPAPTPSPASIVLNAGVNVLVSQASTTANYVINSSAGDSALIFEIGDAGTHCASNTITLGGGSGNLVSTYGALPANVDLCVVSPIDGITLTVTAQ